MLINFNHIKTFFNALVQKMKGFRGNWEQNDDTADDYIKNRTHWSEGIKEIETVLVNNLTADVYYDNNPYRCNFVPGQSYDVTWNGTLYKNVICRFEGGYNVLGGTNGYPFYIDDDGGNDLYVDGDDGNWTVSISIREIKEIIHKLDKKFIDMPDLPNNLVTEDNIYGILENTIAPVSFTNNYESLDNKPTIDSALSTSSANAVSNSSVTTALNSKIELKEIKLPSQQSWLSICYGNGVYVAIAQNSNIVAYSTDGIIWLQSNLPITTYWTAISYGNGKFVAVSFTSNTGAYSTDGITWSAITLPSAATRWTSVCYGNDKFVALSSSRNTSGSTVAAYSLDGITWTQITLPISEAWTSVCYDNGRFVAVAGDPSSGLSSSTTIYSIDGITWERGGYLHSYTSWREICYGNGKFVAMAGSTNWQSNQIEYSIDGKQWEMSATFPSAYWSSMCYGADKFVAISGIAYNSNIAAYSVDGEAWVQIELPISAPWRSICYENGRFMAIASSGTIISSIDGVVWTIEKALVQNDNNIAESVATVLRPCFTDIVQPDLSQNDPNAADYVKNREKMVSNWEQTNENELDYVKGRTHYLYDEIIAETQPGASMHLLLGYLEDKRFRLHEGSVIDILNADGSLFYRMPNAILSSIVGATTKRVINGYECTTSSKMDRNTKLYGLSISGLPSGCRMVYKIPNSCIKTLDEKYIPDSIPKVQTAIVGQTVVVKVVDENGKPTEWETVDFPTALPNPNALTINGTSYDGSEVVSVVTPQADWSQNDPNAADYVKNRTHYEKTENVVIAEEQTIRSMTRVKSSIAEYSTDGYLRGDCIVLGETYVVTYDGVDYVGEAYGDSGIVGLFGPLNEWADAPFFLMAYGVQVTLASQNTATAHTIKIARVIREDLKKLDIKYLPEGYPYEKVMGVNLIEDAAVETIGGRAECVASGGMPIVGRLYTLVVSGSTVTTPNVGSYSYSRVAWYHSERNAVIIGNGSFVGSEDNVDDTPFAIEFYEDNGKIKAYFNADDGEHGFSVAGPAVVAIPIDNKFLPDDVATKADIFGAMEASY